MSDIDKIIADRPFHRFMTIETVEPLSGSSAVSGQSFIVTTDDRRRFKLRRCKDAAQAEGIEDTVRRFSHIFPKFYGRDGRYLLLEALDGYRDCTKEDLRRNARAVGRLCAEINQAESISDHDHERFFRNRMAEILAMGAIDQELHDTAIAKYLQLIEELEVKVGMDLNDIHPKNFMIDKHGNVLYVDEQGIAYRLRSGNNAHTIPKELEYLRSLVS